DAVYNMVDKNRLRKDILRRLKVVTGDKHNFQIEKEIK
ncbi:MAG: uL13 family ribosomal protein, partial [Candidatus Doudnabacteria bacterium]|nr:uL13 family ribosomal protein [Candidatus Doudnabacteria bacterium]